MSTISTLAKTVTSTEATKEAGRLRKMAKRLDSSVIAARQNNQAGVVSDLDEVQQMLEAAAVRMLTGVWRGDLVISDIPGTLLTE
ncbi:MAG: hypothetical protein SH850_31025 [Planctomycetaceae bacterium]|nr:hypothetical protein [Planctomycetaceae bacterium]